MLDRRGALTLAARLGLASTGMLAACSDTTSDARRGSTTTVRPGSGRPLGAAGTNAAATVAAYDPAVAFWKQGNFAPVLAETTATDLEVSGSLPPELDGLYARNGSNAPANDATHWFLGDGMVHGIRFEHGTATWYRNRYVDTPNHRSGGGLLGGGIPGGAVTLSNVSVVHHGGRLLSLGEIGYPYEISTDDLATVGVHDFAGALTTSMTAHPKIDPATGRMHSFGYSFAPPYLTYHVIEPDGRLVSAEEVAVAGSTMMHDFAITERYVVFWEGPVVFDTAAISTGMPYRWSPEYGARVGVMPLGGPTSMIRWAEIDPCFVFHGVNAFEDGDDVVIDVCQLPEAFGPKGFLQPSHLHRWRVSGAGDPTGSLRVTVEQRDDTALDLPTIDRRLTGRAARHAWLASTVEDGPAGFELAGVSHYDLTANRQQHWNPGDHYRAGEVTFVPRPGTDADPDGADGWVVCFAYDRTTDRSDLVVLDALHIDRGPVAQVHLPVRVPFGFHGCWIAAEIGRAHV